MIDRRILLTAPCGCQVYEDHAGHVTWGVERCQVHTETDTLPDEVREYFR